LDVHAKLLAILEMDLHLFSEMGYAKDDIRIAFALEELELVLDEWLAIDVNHAFWYLLGNRVHPGGKAARDDDYLCHDTTIMVWII
jgi:hypothetical protein